MFAENIEDYGTRDKRINALIKIEKFKIQGEEAEYAFAEAGVTITYNDLTCPELPWSEFDGQEIRFLLRETENEKLNLELVF